MDRGAAKARAGIGQQPVAREPRQLRGVTPDERELLGRERELDWLQQAYEACCRGQRPVVLLLSGESGIGKTLLVQSFLAERVDALVLIGRCYEAELVPYKAFDAPIAQLSRYLLQVPAAELAALLPPDFVALCRLFPVLARVAAPGSGLTPESEDEHELRRRGFAALEQLLGRIRERLPVLLWIDDLQCADADSTSLLLSLLRQPRAPKILLIASHRSDPAAQHPGLVALYETLASDVRLEVRALELGPLPHDGATALLEQLGCGSPSGWLEPAREQGHGQPLLLEELARHAALRSPESDAWPSLDELIAARVAQLSGPERHLLELLAIAGRPLSEELAAAASGQHWPAVLQRLCALRLARRSAVDGCVSCCHDAVGEAVASRVSLRRARQCHRALARGLLRAAVAQPEHLAFHLRGAGHPRRAAEQLAVAARRAASALAFERAAQLAGSALELGRFARSEAYSLRLAQAQALSAAGHGNEAAQLYLRLAEERGATGGAEATQVLELRMRAAEHWLQSGQLEQGLELLRALLQPLGVRVPKSALGALASLAYQRTRLRLRGYHFQARPVPQSSAQRLQLVQRASAALTGLDPLWASELHCRSLLLALELGSAEAIAATLVADLVVGTLFAVSETELARRRERAERACQSFGATAERALLHAALATLARCQAPPDLPAARAHLDHFFELHRLRLLAGTAHDRASAEWTQALVRCVQGELAAVAREVPARLDDGWARGDLCIVPLWAGGDPLLARLAVGDVEGAERDWARAERAWSCAAFSEQDLSLALGASHLQRYRGNARAAWQIAQAAQRRLQTSALRGIPDAVDTVASLHGYAALELAAQTQNLSERRQLLQLARRLQRPPLRHHLPALSRGYLLDAAWHFQSGDLERAALVLGRAEPLLESSPVYHQAVRYRRGLLLGGEQGALLRAGAQRFLSAAGAVDPERLLDLLLPGYGPSSSHTPRPPASERRTRP